MSEVPLYPLRSSICTTESAPARDARDEEGNTFPLSSSLGPIAGCWLDGTCGDSCPWKKSVSWRSCPRSSLATPMGGWSVREKHPAPRNTPCPRGLCSTPRRNTSQRGTPGMARLIAWAGMAGSGSPTAASASIFDCSLTPPTGGPASSGMAVSPPCRTPLQGHLLPPH